MTFIIIYDILTKLKTLNKKVSSGILIDFINRFYTTFLIDFKDIMDFENILVDLNSELTFLSDITVFTFIQLVFKFF